MNSFDVSTVETPSKLGSFPISSRGGFPTPAGGRPETYAMLNEDQVTFAVQLSRNTKEVVQFKLALTQAFSKAKQQIQLQQKQIANLNEAIERLEAALAPNNAAVGDFQFTQIDLNLYRLQAAISDFHQFAKVHKKDKTSTGQIQTLTYKVENIERYLERIEKRLKHDEQCYEQLLPLLFEHQQLLLK